MEVMPGVTVVGVEVYGSHTPSTELENDNIIKGLETFDMDSQAYMDNPSQQGPQGGKNKNLPIPRKLQNIHCDSSNF